METLQYYLAYYGIRQPNGCLTPNITSKENGYPRISVDGKMQLLSRVILSLKLGRPISEDKECCHTCDNKACFEPEHLYEGTRLDNMKDARERNRSRYFRSDGKCANGLHDVTLPGALYFNERNPRGFCAECQKIANRNYYARKKVGTNG